MAYEYECEEVIKNVIKELIYFKKGKNELAEKEIDEIYAKAQAFDEIMKGELGAYYDKAKTFDEILNIDLCKHEEEYAADVLDIVDEYKERADDER